MFSDALQRIPPRYWTLLALLVWGGLALLLLRYDPYGLDEGGARALLLNWSIVDNVANPIVIFGVPDFRALLFIPLGIYWSGSILATKVFTALMAFIAVALLYRWSCKDAGREVALIASGLLLIAPLMLMQIDAVDTGPYLLLALGLGVWLDETYRVAPRPLGGKYFFQLLLIAIAVSLHPAGLAYPLALAWVWYQDPLDSRQQRHIYIGATLTVTFVLLLRGGWPGLEWLSNPLDALASIVLGPRLEDGINIARSTAGLIMAALLLLVVALSRGRLLSDLMGRLLLLALIIGLFAAGPAWALLALVVVVYYGASLVISFNESAGGPGFAGQRGGVLLLLFIVATWFMMLDRDYATLKTSGLLSPEDQLIRVLALEVEDSEETFRTVSQWPARTMIACKCEVLPLPPPAGDGAALLESIAGVDYLVFDSFDPDNEGLAKNIAELGGATETVALLEGGVILRVRDTEGLPAGDGER